MARIQGGAHLQPHAWRPELRWHCGQKGMHGQTSVAPARKMALTLQDLHAAAFGASLQDLQDVALANMVCCFAIFTCICSSILTGLTGLQGLEDINKLSVVHQALSLNLSVSS